MEWSVEQLRANLRLQIKRLLLLAALGGTLGAETTATASAQTDPAAGRQDKRKAPVVVASITREMAIEIADQDLVRRKILAGSRRGHSHIDPTTWEEYESKDVWLKTSAKERYSYKKALSGRSFWFVHYMYKKYGGWDFRHGDDIRVFVDATTGEVLLVRQDD